MKASASSDSERIRAAIYLTARIIGSAIKKSMLFPKKKYITSALPMTEELFFHPRQVLSFSKTVHANIFPLPAGPLKKILTMQ